MEENTLAVVNDQLFQAIEAGDELPELNKQEEKRVMEHVNKLSLRFMRDAIKMAGIKSMNLLVRTAQSCMHTLLNYLHRKQLKNHTKLRSRIQDALCSFLYSLKDHYTDHFDHNASMPLPVWLPLHEKLLQAIGPGEDSVFEGMEYELVSVVKNSLEDIGNGKTPSYRMADYWTMLLEKVSTTLPGSGNTTLRAIFTLVAYNFNSVRFVQYLVDRYMAGLPTAGNALEQWKHNLLHVNRIIEVPGYALYVNAPSCKHTLTNMIQTEIAACNFTREGETFMASQAFLKYGLSVQQLALFLRVQVEAGIFVCDNITEFFKIICLHSCTTRADGLSAESLLKKYYEKDRGSIMILLEYNARMHNLLKSYLR
jgi:hypothetical protein